MGRRKKTGGRDFQPGVSGNPNGRPKLPQELREFRKATREEILSEIQYLWSFSIEDLQKIAGDFYEKTVKGENGEEDRKTLVFMHEADGGIPAIRVALARILLNAARFGNMFTMDKLLDRVIGKTEEKHDHKYEVNHTFHSKVVALIEELDNEPKGGQDASKKEKL